MRNVELFHSTIRKVFSTGFLGISENILSEAEADQIVGGRRDRRRFA